MENLTLVFDDSGDQYDKALKGTLPDDGQVKIIVKDRATEQGDPGVMVTFGVEVDDGRFEQAQTCITAKLFTSAARAILARFPHLLD